MCRALQVILDERIVIEARAGRVKARLASATTTLATLRAKVAELGGSASAAPVQAPRLIAPKLEGEPAAAAAEATAAVAAAHVNAQLVNVVSHEAAMKAESGRLAAMLEESQYQQRDLIDSHKERVRLMTETCGLFDHMLQAQHERMVLIDRVRRHVVAEPPSTRKLLEA